MLTSKYNSSRHYLVVNSELGRWLDKEFPVHPGLFVYLHLQTWNWVIGYWTNKQNGNFIDLMNLGKSPFNLGTAGYPVESLRDRLLNPQGRARNLSHLLREGEYSETMGLQDTEMVRWERHQKRKIQIVVPSLSRACI